MKVVTRHLGKEILIATSFVLFALVALFAFFDIVGQANKIGVYYDFKTALYLMALNLPSRIYETMPIAALLGAVYTMSRWASTSEFTILRISGLSQARLALMLIPPALLLIGSTYVLGEWVAPNTDRMRADMRAVLLKRRVTARGFHTGVWVKDYVYDNKGDLANIRYVNVRNLVAGKQGSTGAWRAFEFDAKNRLLRVIHAPRASYIMAKGWRLERATIDTIPQFNPSDNRPLHKRAGRRGRVNTMLRSDMTPDILEVLTIKPEVMGIGGLYRYIEHLRESGQDADRYRFAFWNKVFYPLAIFVMMAMGMLFAYLNTRSGGVSVKIFFGLMIGITFYALNNIFGFLGTLNTWPPIIVAIFPTAVMLVVATVALYLVEKR